MVKLAFAMSTTSASQVRFSPPVGLRGAGFVLEALVASLVLGLPVRAFPRSGASHEGKKRLPDGFGRTDTSFTTVRSTFGTSVANPERPAGFPGAALSAFDWNWRCRGPSEALRGCWRSMGRPGRRRGPGAPGRQPVRGLDLRERAPARPGPGFIL
jgi:hypothetical protein